MYANHIRKSLENQKRETDALIASADDYNEIMKEKELVCNCKKPSTKKQSGAGGKTDNRNKTKGDNKTKEGNKPKGDSGKK